MTIVIYMVKTIDLIRSRPKLYNPNCILNDQSNQIDKKKKIAQERDRRKETGKKIHNQQ